MDMTKRCIERVSKIHPDLRRVVYRAADLLGNTHADGLGFVVTEGMRTPARQAELVKAGASQTMSSRHLTGHAVDIAATVGGKVRWDWPLYYKLANVFFEAARIENVPIEWGGDWPKLRDGPHYQLPHAMYPRPREKSNA